MSMQAEVGSSGYLIFYPFNVVYSCVPLYCLALFSVPSSHCCQQQINELHQPHQSALPTTTTTRSDVCSIAKPQAQSLQLRHHDCSTARQPPEQLATAEAQSQSSTIQHCRHGGHVHPELSTGYNASAGIGATVSATATIKSTIPTTPNAIPAATCTAVDGTEWPYKSGDGQWISSWLGQRLRKLIRSDECVQWS